MKFRVAGVVLKKIFRDMPRSNSAFALQCRAIQNDVLSQCLVFGKIHVAHVPNEAWRNLFNRLRANHAARRASVFTPGAAVLNSPGGTAANGQTDGSAARP